MRILFFCIFIFAASLIPCKASSPDQISTDVSLSAAQLKIIEKAEIIFQKVRFKWSDYRVRLHETEANFEVSFWNPADDRTINYVRATSDGTQHEIYGSSFMNGKTFVVTLDKTSLKVIDTQMCCK